MVKSITKWLTFRKQILLDFVIKDMPQNISMKTLSLIYAINERDFRSQQRDKIEKVLLNTQFHEMIPLCKMCY